MKLLLPQMDLINMRQLLHGDYKWILGLHVVDHWLKFQSIYPLTYKSATDVANALHKWAFPVIELPSGLQSDNGREYLQHTNQWMAE